MSAEGGNFDLNLFCRFQDGRPYRNFDRYTVNSCSNHAYFLTIALNLQTS